MTTTTHTATAPLTFSKVETSFKAYTVLSTIALVAVAALAINGHPINTFMWVRGVLLPVVAVLLYRMTRTGSRRALDRVRTLTRIMPIAIVGVDLIPGVCPLWYAALQAVCMVPVIVAAVITRGADFPKTR
jgi:uncharacterized membrane protein YfhO